MFSCSPIASNESNPNTSPGRSFSDTPKNGPTFHFVWSEDTEGQIRARSLSLSLSKLSGRSSSTHRSPNVGLGASISLRPLGELDRAGGGTGPAPLRAQTSSNERNQLRSCDKRSWFRPPLPPVHWAVRALHGVLGANRWLEPNWLGDTGLAQWWARVDMSTDSLRE